MKSSFFVILIFLFVAVLSANSRSGYVIPIDIFRKYDNIQNAGCGILKVTRNFQTDFKIENNDTIPVYDSKYGFIDFAGNSITELKYVYLGDFHEGLAVACLDSGYGYLDTLGQVIIPFQFRRAFPFSEGLAAVIYPDNNYGYIDKSGRNAFKKRFLTAGAFKDGVAEVSYEGLIRGLINSKGITIFSPRKCHIHEPKDGLIMICDYSLPVKKFGYINTSGQIIVPFIYDEGRSFCYNLACVSQNGKWGIINNKGEAECPLKFDFLHPLNDDVFRYRSGNKKGVCDREGNIISPPRFREIDSFEEGLACVKTLSHKCGYIDQSGKLVIDTIYDYGFGFSEGLAVVIKDKKYGYINKAGKVICKLRFIEARSFSGGLAFVNLNDRWGVIDHSFKVVIPFKYDEIESFNEGWAKVYIEKNEGYVNIYGEEFWPAVNK